MPVGSRSLPTPRKASHRPCRIFTHPRPRDLVKPGNPVSLVQHGLIPRWTETSATSRDACAGGTGQTWACCGSADSVLARSASRSLICHAPACCQSHLLRPHQTGRFSHEHASPPVLCRARQLHRPDRRNTGISSSFFLQPCYRSPRFCRVAYLVSWRARFLLRQRLIRSTGSDVSIDSPNCRFGFSALCSSWSAPHALNAVRGS